MPLMSGCKQVRSIHSYIHQPLLLPPFLSLASAKGVLKDGGRHRLLYSSICGGSVPGHVVSQTKLFLFIPCVCVCVHARANDCCGACVKYVLSHLPVWVSMQSTLNLVPVVGKPTIHINRCIYYHDRLGGW